MARGPGSAKRFAYILNYVNERDTSHFVHVLKLVEEVQRLSWQVDVLSEKGGEGVRVVRGVAITYLSQSNPVLRIVRMVGELIRLRRNGGRLVFVRISRVAALVSILCGVFGIRTIFWHSGATHDFDRSKPLLQRLVDDAIFRLIVAGCHRFVTGPESMLTYYRDTYGVPSGKLALLYNDIDLTRFVPSAAPSGAGTLRVLQVGRFSPVREMTRYAAPILAALHSVARHGYKVEWTLIGDGPDLDKIRKILEPSGDVHVRFLGAVPNVEIARHYAEADLFIMPSYREGMPRVAMEAMAAGLPLVSTDAGGTADLFGPKQKALVIPRHDAARFADVVEQVLLDPQLRTSLGVENRREMERFSTPAVARMYDRLLTASLEGADT